MRPSPKRLWLLRAGRLAAVLPRERLHPAVLAWSEGRRAATGPWAVAFSGGADSLALLLLLWTHWPRRRARLVALHFNHRLRGRAARADELFCRRVCAALGIRFVCGRWRTPDKRAGEAGARAARFSFFGTKLRAAGGRALWLGHQQDDIAETMLMRLTRGSGTAGMAAPRPVQHLPGGRVHLRPLLTLKKMELTGALRAAGIRWREDRTNTTGDFFRNRIRGSVLPSWLQAAAERDALAGAALTRELLEEDDAALECWLDGIRVLHADGGLDLRKLSGRPRALLRRSLHRWLLRQPDAGKLSRQGFTALLNAVEAGRPTRQSLGAKGFAVIRGRWLRFVRK